MSTVKEGTCPKGGQHEYTPGFIICHKCGCNRLRQPENADLKRLAEGGR